MKIGKHKDTTEEWKLGDMRVEECKTYKYLGDEISQDGKNTTMIESRKHKMNVTTITINTIASSEILSKIETSVLLQLHEKISIPSLLNNSESWRLSIGEIKDLETIETQAIKNTFDLPIHTPTPALYYSFGLPYTKIRIEKKQLTFLHKILNRDTNDWTRKTLETLVEKGTGWSQSIQKTLEVYELPDDLNTIRSIPSTDWKNIISTIAEKKHTERLLSDCTSTVNNTESVKTKTKTIHEDITRSTYKRTPRPELLHFSKYETKTTIIARYGMLECGTNYKGTMQEKCDQCKVKDDENHRLNYCVKLRGINFVDCDTKIEFNNIYSNDPEVLRTIIKRLGNIWNTKTAHGTMIR